MPIDTLTPSEELTIEKLLRGEMSRHAEPTDQSARRTDYEHANYSIRKVGTCFALTITFPDGPSDEYPEVQTLREYRTFDSWSEMNNFILEHMYIIPHQAQHDARTRSI